MLSLSHISLKKFYRWISYLALGISVTALAADPKDLTLAADSKDLTKIHNQLAKKVPFGANISSQ